MMIFSSHLCIFTYEMTRENKIKVNITMYIHIPEYLGTWIPNIRVIWEISGYLERSPKYSNIWVVPETQIDFRDYLKLRQSMMETLQSFFTIFIS